MSEQVRAPDFDPSVSEDFTSAHDVHREMRSRCPVAFSDKFNGFWALFKYRDIAKVLGDSKTFITSVQNVVPKVAFTGRRPPLHMDPPAHTPYRKALNPLFRAQRMDELEPRIRQFAAELLDPFFAAGGGDVTTAFAYKLPINVLGEFFNIPVKEAVAIREVGSAYNLALQSGDDAGVKRTSLMLYDVARDLIAKRRAKPLDPSIDPVNALLEARPDGEPFPDEMILGCIRQMLVVGIIAPTVTIGAMVAHLAEHPDLQAQLRADPKLIPEAIEELLRLYSPYRGFARTANRDVEIGGRLIKEGEPIALVYTSANRDEEVFPDPDEFKWGRQHNEHMVFGRGPHQCLGTPLARLELRVAMEEFLARSKHFTMLEPIAQMTRWPEYGPISVKIRVTT